MMKKIILHAQQKIGKERSVFGLFHILQGRSSIQTIQDAKLYKLRSLYGIYRKLSRERFMAIVDQLIEDGLLKQITSDNYVPTDNGRTWLHAREAIDVDLMYINGKKYSKQDRILFNRMQLVIQVWTNIKKGNHQFIPVVEDQSTVHWVKQFYQRTKTKLDIYLGQLYEELHQLFLSLPDIYPEVFLAQLSSYHYIGQTIEQIAVEYQLTKEDVYLMTTNVLHYIISEVKAARDDYPVLNIMMKQQSEAIWTSSAQATAHYLDEGYSLEEIAIRRSLKVNTIYDHVVELAMHGHQAVHVHDYVTDEAIHLIEHTVKQVGTFRLKTIKEMVGESISYFQIRLVLATMKT